MGMPEAESAFDVQAHRRGAWALGIVLLVAFALYAPGLGGEFVYDDHDVIERNPRLAGLAELPTIFGEQVWGFDATKAGGTGYYRPLFTTTLLVLRLLFGPSPAAFHVAALAFHLSASVLLYRVALRLGLSIAAGVTASAVFALHPVQIQAVAWASAISDPLVVCLGLGAVLAADAWRRGGSDRTWGGALIAFFASLLVLERAVAFAVPLVLVATGFVFSRSGPASTSPARRARVAALVLLPIALVATMRAVALDAVAGASMDPLATLFSLPTVLSRYLLNLVAPTSLALAYPERLVRAAPNGVALHAGVVALAVLMLAYVASTARRRAFAVISAVACFAPATLLFALPAHALVQDRYLYAPLAFLGLAVADVAFPAVPREARSARWLVAVVAAALGVSWLAAFPSQRRPYANDLALYQRAVASAPENALFLMNLANAERRAGRADVACARLQRAAAALERDPRIGDAPLLFFNLGNCHNRHGRPQPALAAYARAIDASHGRFEAPFVNATALLLAARELDAALALAEDAVSRNPRSAALHRLRAYVHLRRGEREAGREAIAASLALEPDDPESLLLARELAR